jgi:hypothetical protein
MGSIVESVPGVLDTRNWPAPFSLKEPVWLERDADGILIVYERGPVLTDRDHRYELPEHFEALIVDEDNLPAYQLRIVVTPAGPACTKLTLVAASDDEPLTTTQTRIPLRELVNEIVLIVGSLNRKTGRYEPESFERELAATFARPEPGKKIQDEHFEHVAEIYRYALERGRPPTEGVAEAFDVSRSTAGRWVVETRRRGLLGPAVPGVAGEQEPPPKARRRKRAARKEKE